MPIRVAFDLDGTIADMQSVLRVEAERLFGASPPRDESAGSPDDSEAAFAAAQAHLALTREQQTALWDHVRTIENFWVGLPEIQPGVVARIAELAGARRWEVIFLTTRPFVAGDTVQVQSQRWLDAHGFRLPSVFVVRQSRGKIAAALELDAVVDDRAENCRDVVLDSKARAILVWQGDGHVPLGVDRLSVRVVPTISEALEVLTRMDDRKQQRRSTRALRTFFGKETTA